MSVPIESGSPRRVYVSQHVAASLKHTAPLRASSCGPGTLYLSSLHVWPVTSLEPKISKNVQDPLPAPLQLPSPSPPAGADRGAVKMSAMRFARSTRSKTLQLFER